ncbi:hypothetical protein [Chromobacterium violaceum]|uniref:hypothetical protein n=1 Tax=Chromobacterium violaceum TaxID=536 RepID=UPI0012D480C1|nr:hypothetical protein [Chromobacterium violaceum]
MRAPTRGLFLLQLDICLGIMLGCVDNIRDDMTDYYKVVEVIFNLSYPPFILFVGKKFFEHGLNLKLERLKSRLAGKNSREIEEVKAELDRSKMKLSSDIQRISEKQNSAYGVLTDGQRIWHECRIKHLEEFWSAYIELLNSMPSYMDILNYSSGRKLSEREMDRIDNVLNYPILYDLYKKNLNPLRLYVGDVVWYTFDCFFQAVFQIIFSAVNINSEWDNYNYKDDRKVEEYISVALGEEALREYLEVDGNRIYWIFRRFDAAIVKALEDAATGVEASNKTAMHFSKIDSAVGKYEIKDGK